MAISQMQNLILKICTTILFHMKLMVNEFIIVQCGSPPAVIVADILSFNAKIGVVDF